MGDFRLQETRARLDGRVEYGWLAVNDVSSKLNLELMYHSEDLNADLFVFAVRH
jgi:hypothetical protein